MPVQEKFESLATAIETQLADLAVKIELYDDSIFMFRIKSHYGNVLIDGLNPAYANGGDYRRIILALESK